MAKKSDKKSEASKGLDHWIKVYQDNYKKLIIIPVIVFILALFFIYQTIQVDGTPINRDVSLKGGLSAIINVDTSMTDVEVKENLENSFSDFTFSVSELFEDGARVGFIIDTDMEEEAFITHIEGLFGVPFEFGENYSSNFISPTLSNAFFLQAVYILIISLVLMSVVIFIYFRAFVPSMALVISAIFDIIVTIGVLNLMEFKVSIAGIGALLMIVGYSIDTDVLLTNRLYKEQGYDYFEKLGFAFKTGMLMTGTTLIAGIAAMILTNSEVIFEIALILVVGLLVDFISTWFQNASILLWWLDDKK